MKWKQIIVAVMLIVCMAGCFMTVQSVDVSPDSKTLVLSRFEGGVIQFGVDGSNPKLFAKQGWGAKFSPDGSQIVFQSITEKGTELILVNTSTDESTILRTWEKEKGGKDPLILPTWNSNGAEIAYVQWYPDGQYDDSAFSAKLHIIEIKSLEDRIIEDNVGLYCRWSPDGESLAYYRFKGSPISRDMEEFDEIGSLKILDNDGPRTVARIVMNIFADVTWLSNDHILFATPILSLPAPISAEADIEEAVYLYDLQSKTVAPVLDTKGLSWRDLSSLITLSPDRRRLLFGTYDRHSKATSATSDETKSGRITLWCYDFAKSKRTMLVESVGDGYPFWIGNAQIGYFESPEKIVIADISDNSQITSKRTLDLEKIFAPIMEKEEKETPDKPGGEEIPKTLP